MKLRAALVMVAAIGCRNDPAAPPVPPVQFDSTSITVFLGHHLRVGVSGGGRQLAWSANSAHLDIERDGTVTGLSPGNGWVYASDGKTTDSVMVRVVVQFVSVAAGSDVSCGRSNEGRVLCWGSNFTSTLGDSTIADAVIPHVLNADISFSSIVLGGGTICGVSKGLVCWGYNGVGQVGDGTTRDRVLPALVSDTLGLVQASLGAGATSCASDFANRQYCWGWNAYNQLLDSSFFNWRRPVAMPIAISQLSPGGGHVCGLDSLGAAWCWGRNEYGQVGDSTTGTQSVPALVTGHLDFRVLATGREHTCGLTTAGHIFCWGHNDRGQLGRGDVTQSSVPLPIASALVFDTVVSTAFHTCALSSAVAYCWGANASGQTGADPNPAIVSVQPVAGPPFLSISAGLAHTCALGADGTAWCWGANSSGQLGNGQRLDSPAPQRVLYQR